MYVCMGVHTCVCGGVHMHVSMHGGARERMCAHGGGCTLMGMCRAVGGHARGREGGEHMHVQA